MGGPNLEVFKFSLYLFVPIVALVHFGDPQWYRDHVVPYRNRLFPPLDRTVQSLPTNQSAIKEELERIKAERRARHAARVAEQEKNDQ
ncbi:hypothetical protein NMY22_g6233 [Coprinellus aureogranulatus]|nr:hypothetical protein NMY22_g6233 [Coprinellus aureogranulatus]